MTTESIHLQTRCSCDIDYDPAWSPDGASLVFTSERGDGTADLWTMDLRTRQAKPLTSGPGGDFRPSWSPGGKLIAFSSDRGSTLPNGQGRWEHLHIVDLYVIVFSTSRMGFKDEATYTDSPQPYGELFVMRYEGTRVQHAYG